MLYHHGCPHHHGIGLLTEQGRQWLESLGLPATAREQVTVALGMIGALDSQLAPLDQDLRAYARRQPGCKALMGLHGIGQLTAVTILAELGDARRFCSSRDAVRYCGLDITVKQSDRRRAPGHLSRQGPPALRWALHRRPKPPAARAVPTATTTSRRPRGWAATVPASPSQRKLLKRSYHTLRELGDEALRRREIGRARAALTHADAPRAAPGIVPSPRKRGRPPTTERPQRFPQRDHPINHHVAGPPHGRVADRDTAGRLRALTDH